MATSRSSISREVATWDGEPSTWGDYARKARLCFEMTPPHKRRLLGADLASRLTGRAWAVTPSLDHKKLNKKNGTKYLLKFLQSRLCRTAVPDAGARLEDLLIRLRRPLGMSMSQWANELQEAYRKVQRAMIRARQLQRGKDDGRTISEPQREPQSLPTSPKSPTRSPPTSSPSPSRRAQVTVSPLDTMEEEEEPVEPALVPSTEPEGEDGWDEASWKAWEKKKKKDWYGDDTSSGEDLPWDELETEDLQVLPDEVLGWLLLRRANLSAASRLSVQASVNNSLKFSDIEVALRDQEEELLAADQHRGPGKKRSYWVEDDGCWGLIVTPQDDSDDFAADIHWIGKQLPAEVYPYGAHGGDDYREDDESYWNYEADGWHGYSQDEGGYWWETDGQGSFWAADHYVDYTPEEMKELEESYMAYENKVRTCAQSRQLQRAKGGSRGFFPLAMMKGSGKKGKSKGKLARRAKVVAL